jgi:hypothetical protein
MLLLLPHLLPLPPMTMMVLMPAVTTAPKL